MISYFVYARKSTESEDRQALSIDSQINELKLLARKENLVIEKLFIESKSAKKSGRPVFSSMLKELRQKKVSGILCWKLDRLTRNMLDGATLSDLMEKGVIEEIRTPLQTYRNNSVDRLMSGIDMLFARKYIDDLSENVKRGMKAKVKQGWLPNRAPMGYISDRGEQGFKKIIPDPKRFKLVRRMWDILLTGNYSVLQITQIANDQWGFKTRRTRKAGDMPISKSLLYKTFQNPFYYGYFIYNGELFQGKHKPMITFEEFERGQQILCSKEKSKIQKHIYDFTGIFRCGLCNSMITAETKRKTIRSTGNQKEYTYYHCSYGKNPQCPRQAIRESDLLRQVSKSLTNVSLPAEILDWIFKYYKSVQTREIEKLKQEKNNLIQEINELSKKLQNLLNMKISSENRNNGLLTNEEYLEQKNFLTLEKAKLQRSLNTYLDINRENELIYEVFQLSKYAKAWFISGSKDQKRVILRKVFSNHKITGKKVILEPKKPFTILANISASVNGKNGTFSPDNFGLGKPKSKDNYGQNLDSEFWRSKVNELRTEIREVINRNNLYQ